MSWRPGHGRVAGSPSAFLKPSPPRPTMDPQIFLRAACYAMVAVVEGVEAMAYGAIVYACVAGVAALLLNRFNQTSAQSKRTDENTSSGHHKKCDSKKNCGGKLLKCGGKVLKCSCAICSFAAAITTFLLLAILAWLFRTSGQRPSNDPSPARGGNDTCRSPAPTPFSFVVTLPCSGLNSEAAWSPIHDVNGINQIEDDLSLIARGRLAELKDAYAQPARAFVYYRDLTRTQYDRVQNRGIPRYIEAERGRLLGTADTDCVDVEYGAVKAGFQELQEVGAQCEHWWSVVYGPFGVAAELDERMAARSHDLEKLPAPYIADLVPGMSAQDRENSRALLAADRKLLSSLQDAHGIDERKACSRHERRVMEATWKQATEKDVAGVVLRKDHQALDDLLAARMDWLLLHTSPESSDFD